MQSVILFPYTFGQIQKIAPQTAGVCPGSVNGEQTNNPSQSEAQKVGVPFNWLLSTNIANHFAKPNHGLHL